MIRIIGICLLLLTSDIGFAQEEKRELVNSVGGLSMGTRNTFSLFSTESRTFVGMSVGGQLRLRIHKLVNSDWFGDYVTTNVDDLATRTDFHGGVSIMPYTFGTPSLYKPTFYPLAGFCIDYTRLNVTSGITELDDPRMLERYSFAIQLGVGMQIPLSQRFDFTTTIHYMLHTGSDVHMHLNGDNVSLAMHRGFQLEGHFLTSLSLNYKLFNIWKAD